MAAIDILTAEFAAWFASANLPEGDATELLMFADLTSRERAWLADFVERWEAAAAADPEFYDKQAIAA